MLRLARDVDWTEEDACFRSLAQARSLGLNLITNLGTDLASTGPPVNLYADILAEI